MAIRASRTPVSSERVCMRCPQVLNKPRPGRALCSDCRDVERALESADRKQVDLAALGDDEWFNRKTGTVRKVDEVTGAIRPVAA